MQNQTSNVDNLLTSDVHGRTKVSRLTITRARFLLFVRNLSNLSSSAYVFPRALIRPLYALRKELASRAAPVVIVDFGCGAKPFAEVFEGIEGTYVGLDVYPGRKVDLLYDGAKIPLRDHAIDLVFSSSVFEHVENLEAALSELDRILRPGGCLLVVVPFTNSTHGTPYDFHRPTRFGWMSLLSKHFPSTQIRIVPVDSRANCIINLITSQMNYYFYDLARSARDWFSKGEPGARRRLNNGASSPESASTGLKLAYVLANLNPLNAILGLVGWVCDAITKRKRVPEGEITSGFLIEVRKHV